MTTGPGDPMVPHGYGHVRASTADRERTADVLKAAFAEGRLDQDEYSERLDRLYQTRTYGELAALTFDLPTGPFGSPCLPCPGRQAHPRYPHPSCQRRKGYRGRGLAAAGLILGVAGIWYRLYLG